MSLVDEFEFVPSSIAEFKSVLTVSVTLSIAFLAIFLAADDIESVALAPPPVDILSPPAPPVDILSPPVPPLLVDILSPPAPPAPPFAAPAAPPAAPTAFIPALKIVCAPIVTLPSETEFVMSAMNLSNCELK